MTMPTLQRAAVTEQTRLQFARRRPRKCQARSRVRVFPMLAPEREFQNKEERADAGAGAAATNCKHPCSVTAATRAWGFAILSTFIIRPSSFPAHHARSVLAFALFLLLFTLTPASAPAQRAARVEVAADKTLSVVRVNANAQPWDFFHPWSKRSPYSRRAIGAVIANRQVLVTAELVANANYVELEKAESGEKVAATVAAVDYEANLALLKPVDEAFLGGIKPLEIGAARVGERVSVWQLESTGALLITDALVTTVEVGRYPIEETALLLYRLTSSLQYREGSFTVPVAKDNKLAGLLMRYDTRTQNVDVIPAPVIQHFLKDAADGKYDGFPRAGFLFAALRDPQLRRYAGLNGGNAVNASANATLDPAKSNRNDTSRPDGAAGGGIAAKAKSAAAPGNAAAGPGAGGVYVINVQKGSPADKAGLKEGDVLLAIGDKSIDQDGNYLDEQYGKISMINLISLRGHGETVPFKVYRDGKTQTFGVTLTHRPATDYKIEPYVIDRPPPYFVLGGLVLQELSRQYLREWGGDWQKKAPERLVYYDRYQSELFAEDPRERLVILSQVLPSPGTIGYEELNYIVVTKINDKPLRKLADVVEALKTPIDGFHKIELEENPRVIYLDAAEVAANNETLMKNYGLPAVSRLE